MKIEDLVILHQDWIRKMARHYYTNDKDAEDLAGETIFKCLSQGHRFDPSRPFKPWVVSIMANTYIIQYNRKRLVQFSDYDYSDCYISDFLTDQYEIVRELLSIIRKCARQSCCIECLILSAKGFKGEEIASKLSIPVGTVKSRISAGRKIIRAGIAHKCQ